MPKPRLKRNFRTLKRQGASVNSSITIPFRKGFKSMLKRKKSVRLKKR